MNAYAIRTRAGGSVSVIAKPPPGVKSSTGTPWLRGLLPAGEWAVISSSYEGRFLERVEEGAFERALKRNRERIRIQFNHGVDPRIGGLPIAKLDLAFVDVRGLTYGGELFPTPYVLEILPALKAGLLGSSWRFTVLREDVRDPGRSYYNPEGLTERTIQDMDILEMGPVIFPAYGTSSAGTHDPEGRKATVKPRRSFANRAEWLAYLEADSRSSKF